MVSLLSSPYSSRMLSHTWRAALTAEDVVQLSPKFWQIHRDHIGMPMDGAASVLLTIQYNLCAGTLAQVSPRAPEVDAILRDVLNFDVS